MNPLRIILGIFFVLLGQVSAGMAQTPIPSNAPSAVGTTGGLKAPTSVPRFYGSNPSLRYHQQATGKPCLSVVGSARKQTINPDIYDHVIGIANDCSQPIEVEVCYYKTRDCVTIKVPAYGRKEAMLGIMPRMQEFRFEYKEQFGPAAGLGGVSSRLN
jgi:hypothetical protein